MEVDGERMDHEYPFAMDIDPRLTVEGQEMVLMHLVG
jgi:hypothetical protein